MDVIMSIKPEYANKILSGEKKYEFRKKIWKTQVVERVFIYAGIPVQKIIGVFDVESISKGTPKEIWNKCQDSAGIPKFYFFRYFQNAKNGYAIKVKNPRRFDVPIDPFLDTNFKPPQHFKYIQQGLMK